MEQISFTLKYVGLILYFIFILRFLLLSFKALDDLLLFECKHLPEQWEKDGRPRGMQYWKFPKSSANDFYKKPALSGTSTSPIFWIFITPEWIQGRPEAVLHLQDLRTNLVWWNVGFIVFFFLVTLTLFG